SVSFFLSLFFSYCSPSHPHLTSFPTRRSSDLSFALKSGPSKTTLALLDRFGDAALPAIGSEKPTHWLRVRRRLQREARRLGLRGDRKSTRLNSSHVSISYAVFCLKKKKNNEK